MFDGRFRDNAERALRPVGHQLKRTGLTADHLTLLGVAMAVAAAFAIGSGHLRLGLLLLILTALPDVLDGAVAKASGMASSRGAFFDSTADRVTDALLLGGVAWHLASTETPHLTILPMAVLAASMTISYERAKADALGYNAKGGLMERAERLIALGLGLLFGNLLVPILWIMLALTVVTALQRFVKVWRQATAATPVLAARPTVRTRVRNRQAQRRVARATHRGLRRRSRSEPPTR